MKKILTINFNKRLPDTHSIPNEFQDYGRFAEQKLGWWFGYAKSSHPHTKNGYYWAIRDNTLYISPRGSTYKWTEPLTDDVLKWLIKKIGLRGYSHFRRIK